MRIGSTHRTILWKPKDRKLFCCISLTVPPDLASQKVPAPITDRVYSSPPQQQKTEAFLNSSIWLLVERSHKLQPGSATGGAPESVYINLRSLMKNN